ncbi:MAG: FkbM family methyltransferase [Rhodospirillales bacterium]|nr:FkbM family methyltransferase [Rhodospirillales bacterium]
MEPQIAECRHGRFYINPHDTTIGKSLRTYGEFAEHEIMLLSHLIGPGQTVIDVGANIGTHAVFFSDHVGPGGKVLAIEAQPEVFDLLQRNLALNNCENTKAKNAAVGAAKGALELPALDYNRDGNFGAFSFRIDDIGRYLPLAEGGKNISLPVIPLDDMGLEACHLIKVDVEGMEYEVLAGAARTIGKFKPTLYLENNNKASSPQLIGQVLSLGYQAFWHVISYYRRDNFAKCADNIFSAPLELNLLCLPEGADKRFSNLPAALSTDQWLPDDIAEEKFKVEMLLAINESFGAG